MLTQQAQKSSLMMSRVSRNMWVLWSVIITTRKLRLLVICKYKSRVSLADTKNFTFTAVLCVKLQRWYRYSTRSVTSGTDTVWFARPQTDCMCGPYLQDSRVIKWKRLHLSNTVDFSQNWFLSHFHEDVMTNCHCLICSVQWPEFRDKDRQNGVTV
jgi:hypothetical protein